MGKTEAPNLKGALKEGDAAKKKFDALKKECTQVLAKPTLKDGKQRQSKAYSDCVDLHNDLDAFHKRVSALSQADDPVKLSNYDNKKTAEIQRLKKMMEQLSEMKASLQPDATEDDYYKRVKDVLASEDQAPLDDEEEGDEEYEDEEEGSEEESYEESEYEDEEEEEAETEQEFTPRPQEVLEYEVIATFEKQEEGDLAVMEGDVVTLVAVRDDGWYECENADGERGLVPKTYLEEHIQYKELMTPDVAEPEETDPMSSRSGKALWKGMKKALNETSATDVLAAMGAVPAGFREPTCARLLATPDERYTSMNYLCPKLSTSNLFYKDLFYDTQTEEVAVRIARIQKIVTLLQVKNVPLPGVASVVLSRLVRVCLFDSNKILSNISTVQAECTDKEGRNWTFPNNPVASLESREVFVRISEPSKSVGILIELTVVFTKEKTGRISEMSCGWIFLPMFNDNGTLILNKEYDIQLNGGTPYERGVEVDPTIARRASSKIMSMISRNRQPIITIKTAAANDEQKRRFGMLPSICAGKLRTLHTSSLYRYHLACSIIRDRENQLSTELIHDTFLRSYPLVLEQYDLVDILLERWDIEMKKKSRTEKKDKDVLLKTLLQCFISYIYPLLHIGLPPYRAGFPDVVQQRKELIAKFMSKVTPVEAMLSPEIEFEPFDIQEVAFDVLGRHCISVL